jgi:hypothetical protein
MNAENRSNKVGCEFLTATTKLSIGVDQRQLAFGRARHAGAPGSRGRCVPSQAERGQQFFNGHSVVGGNTLENTAERAGLDRVMLGNNFVVLAAFLGRYPDDPF